jgi:hypothetical protein
LNPLIRLTGVIETIRFDELVLGDFGHGFQCTQRFLEKPPPESIQSIECYVEIVKNKHNTHLA